MTGCAKFFIFLIIAVPLAYIGASYYNGVDPFAKIKEIEIFKSHKSDQSTADEIKNINAPVSNESTLKKELELKNDEIKFLNEKIRKLEDLINAQKKELDKLKKVSG